MYSLQGKIYIHIHTLLLYTIIRHQVLHCRHDGVRLTNMFVNQEEKHSGIYFRHHSKGALYFHLLLY